MYQPESTYRLQFHKDFTFDDLEKVIPYLHELGIKTIYASPVFEAVPGSTHGYDGLNPNAINPEIGTLEQLYRISEQLRTLGMGWIQDFVPNHMAYSSHNKWLCDYLEKGKMSAYDGYFDKNPDEPLMAPFLGNNLSNVLNHGELKVVFTEGRFQFSYFDQLYPLNYTGYSDILNDELFDDKGFEQVRKKLDLLFQAVDKITFQKQWDTMVQSLNELDDQALSIILNGLHEINEDKMFLRKLSDVQFYRLCEWRETNTKINYRRFFTINGLICINIQQPEVFDTYHLLLFKLVQDNVIQGVRIDHIDGLYDPESYLKQLRERLGQEVFIVVEKILEHDEQLPVQWPVQGTTGYDFLAHVNGLLTETAAGPAFDKMYRKLSESEITTEDQVYSFKRMILDRYMQGELDNMVTLFLRLLNEDLQKDIDTAEIKNIIAELLAYCPVYRYYPTKIPLIENEKKTFEELIKIVKDGERIKDFTIVCFQKCFTHEAWLADEEYCVALLHFWRRFMQLSGPLMAKGVEDTLMYNNQKFLAHNEVGDSLSFFGLSTEEFHRLMVERQLQYPFSMNATATHDTKRGEDSRARLQLLSSYQKEWFHVVNLCINQPKTNGELLSMEDKYFVLQVIYAALDFESDGKSFTGRLKAYLIKAAREAKSHSAWDDPNEEYEAALIDYALAVCNPKSIAGKEIRTFLQKNKQGIFIQSIVQLVLKCTCPGIPDIYQGTEFWDNSFVDPDNRRAVDYEARVSALNEINDQQFNIAEVVNNVSDPRFKLFCLKKLLGLRKELPDVFTKGLYEPVKSEGSYFSFIRRYGSDWLLVIIPLGNDSKNNTGQAIELPVEAPVKWKNVFTDANMSVTDFDISKQLKQFPVLVFRSQLTNKTRSAGVLLPLFSLASGHGIGDMGKEAYNFISFLSKSGQKLWQILPLNPVLEKNYFSPYACSSSFAGDPMYIDLGGLVKEGILSEIDILPLEVIPSRSVDYKLVKGNKSAVLYEAWQNAKAMQFLEKDFIQFCIDEAEWLEDYALYTVIKNEHEGKAWYEWPEILRDRSEVHLQLFATSRSLQLEFQKWMQFIFFRQWQMLKAFAKQHNVRFIGDIPFYMSNDSADVWANRSLFEVDASGEMLAIAGVPPDYFSETGQLWGMPVCDWLQHQKQGYHWWLQRLKQNIRLYDLVRLDHFRAFYDYWKISGEAETAINGKWIEGPQDDLFILIKQHFPDMPFIAEDLGEIHQSVFDFKDKYKLPGMRVLQFGFEQYESTLRDLPHNFNCNSIVYTGTHDNNTTLGWFKSLDIASRKALNDYAGFEVNSSNIVETMVKMAYGTVADTLIIPMQDVLGLDEDNRINTPSTVNANWKWRMLPGECSNDHSLMLLQLARRYNR